ncbi:MAG: hypothetical protein L6R36_008293 [Xanthoria steineri]|nr:MAG: hypothetical protein L6R36_008293 [Xanthoria steineri]
MVDQSVTRRVTQIGGNPGVGGIRSLQTQKKRQLALDSPTRNVPISTDRLSFETRRSNDQETSKRAKFNEAKIVSYRKFHTFMELDQAGPAKIARDEKHILVALKAIDSVSESLRVFEADNIVSLRDIFKTGAQTYLVYEFMCVSLRQIQGTPRGLQIRSFEIAAICKEVSRYRHRKRMLRRQILNGLFYMHRELGLFHGNLSCSEVMLDYEGRVKIANVGISMSEKRIYDDASGSQDIRGLGSIMMELMETETWISDPSSLVLQHPEKWKDSHGIKSFLHDIPIHDLEYLKQVSYVFSASKPESTEVLKHEFLPKESLQEICLKELVLVAQVSAINDWEIYTEEKIDQEDLPG